MYCEADRIDRFPGRLHAYEIWRYDAIEGGVEFVFVDTRGFGELRLVHSTKRDEISDYSWYSRWVQ